MKNHIQVYPLKLSDIQQDVWRFSVDKGKQLTKVVVHLDLDEEPNQEEIVNELIRYICAFEKIKQSTTY